MFYHLMLALLLYVWCLGWVEYIKFTLLVCTFCVFILEMHIQGGAQDESSLAQDESSLAQDESSLDFPFGAGCLSRITLARTPSAEGWFHRYTLNIDLARKETQGSEAI